MAYLSAAEIQEYVGSEIAGDSAFLNRCLAAAEDTVNDFCGRSFDAPVVTSFTRKYIPFDDLVVIDDIVDTTNLVIADRGSTVAAAGYQLEPLNNLSAGGIVQPYYIIRRLYAAWLPTFNEATVSVTSTRWGWAAVPPQVKEATAILAKDFAHLRQNRFGVAGFGEFGVVRVRDNPHVTMLLAKLRHPAATGIA